MMDNVFSQQDSKRFWEKHNKGRQARDKQLAGLPFSEKVAMTEKLQADYEVLRNSKEDSGQFGLGEMSPDAMNELSIERRFTQGDFDEALNKVFPFTQELQGDQESSGT